MVVMWAVIIAALLYQVYADVTDPSRGPEIFTAVDRCSGLDDAALVPRAFNLTVTVDNLGGKYNVRVGGDAVVLYGGVPFVTGVMEDLSVLPHGTAEVAVHAGSGGLVLPEELAAVMAEELKCAGGVVRLEVCVLSLNHTSLMCTANLNLGGGAPAPAPSPCEHVVLRDESDVQNEVLRHAKSTGPAWAAVGGRLYLVNTFADRYDGAPCFEVLGRCSSHGHAGDDWSWELLPSPLLLDMPYEYGCLWSLPFVGRVQHVVEYDRWLGFSGPSMKLCSAELTDDLTGDGQDFPLKPPVHRDVWDDIDGYTLAPAWCLARSDLMCLGSAWCLARSDLTCLGCGKFCVT
ncbi:hypothetical protein BAE44_0023912, partial [Dichanthelium oligosanthes]